MRKVRIIEHISLDGVIQAPGGRNEDGTITPTADGQHHIEVQRAEAVADAQGGTLDLLLGRRTYDIWAGFWPKVTNGPMADGLNAATKYVATHRPDSLGWGPVEGAGLRRRRRCSPHQVERRAGLDCLGQFDADVGAARTWACG